MKIFKPKKFMVTFASYDAMREFERYVFDCEVLAGITVSPCVVEQIGPNESGDFCCVYEIKWNKTREFKLMIGRYNLYAKIFSSKYRVNGWEKL